MLGVRRFILVSAGGAVVDIAIAYAVASQLGTPLWLSAIAGFTAAALGNYIVHEIWTFRRENSSLLSGGRAISYSAASGIVLLSRLGIVTWLGTWVGADYKVAVLAGGVAVSFFLNYFISKTFIFVSTQSKR